MPRTKRVTKRTGKKSVERGTSISSERAGNHTEHVDQAIKEFDKKCKEDLHSLRMRAIAIKQQLRFIITEARLSIPSEWGNRTVEEARNSKDSTFMHTISDTASSSNIFELKSTRQKRHASKKRSLSVAQCDDEGYHTVESEGNSVGGSRASRTLQKQEKPKRVSRSVSKSRIAQLSGLKTPLNPIPANYFGTVTPKVKPNTPQVILRRPKEGEMAISMQGSPLLVNTIVSKEANVNIPLDDGRTISIQPQLGLRMSQLPHMDPNVMSQIKTLRDNLIKICQVPNNRI